MVGELYLNKSETEEKTLLGRYLPLLHLSHGRSNVCLTELRRGFNDTLRGKQLLSCLAQSERSEKLDSLVRACPFHVRPLTLPLLKSK